MRIAVGSKVIDLDGRRVTAGELRKRLIGTTIPESEKWRYDPGRGINLDTIASAISNAENGRMAELTDLSTKTLDVDPNLASLVGRRIGAIEALGCQVVEASGEGIEKERAKKIAAIVRREISMLPAPSWDTSGPQPMAGIRPLVSALAWGLWDGRSAIETVWGDVKDPSRGVATAIRELVWIHPRRLSFGPTRELRLQEAWWQLGDFAPVGVDLTKARFKFVTWTPQYFREYPEREGYATRAMYFSFFKRFGAREMLVLAELFGKPWKIIELDENSRLQPNELEELDQNVERLGERDQARLQKGAKLTIPWPHPDSGTIHQGIIDAADSQLARLILGQPFTSLQNSANKSQSDVGEGQQDLLLDKDAAMLAPRLTASIALAIVTLNAQKLGLENDYQIAAYCPQLVLKSQDEIDENLETDRLSKALSAGLPVALGQAYELTGYRRPEDEEVIAQVGGVTTIFNTLDAALEAIKAAHADAEAQRKQATAGGGLDLESKVHGNERAAIENEKIAREPPPAAEVAASALGKPLMLYRDDQARDDRGRWAVEGAADTSDAREDRRANLRVRVRSVDVGPSEERAMLGKWTGKTPGRQALRSVRSALQDSPILRGTLERFPLSSWEIRSHLFGELPGGALGYYDSKERHLTLITPEILRNSGYTDRDVTVGTDAPNVGVAPDHWSTMNERGQSFADRRTDGKPARIWFAESDQSKLYAAVLAHEVGHHLDSKLERDPFTDYPSAQLMEAREAPRKAWLDRAYTYAQEKHPWPDDATDEILDRRNVAMRATLEKWKAENPEPKTGPVSLYAMSNHKEDFAETFAAFVVYPTALREHDPIGYDFMERTLERAGILVDRRDLRASEGAILLAFDESKHPRGQPNNKGQFGPGGGGGGDADHERAAGARAARAAERMPKPTKPAATSRKAGTYDAPEHVTAEVKDWDRETYGEEVLAPIRREVPFVPIKEGTKLADAKRDVTKNTRLAVSQYVKHLSGEDANSLRTWADDTAAAFVEAYPEADAATVDGLLRGSVDRIMVQHRESMGRALTDHGVRHITGDVQNGNEILDAMASSGVPVEAKDRALMAFALAHHDYGYTAPSQRETFKNDDHIALSAEVFASDVEPELAKVVGAEDAAFVRYAIGTHSSAALDWENEPLVSAIRCADNFSVFSSQKLPNVFRDVEGATVDLDAMYLARGDAAKFDKAKASLVSRIESSDLEALTKQELLAATKDVSMNTYTPNVFMGRLAGDLSRFEFGNVEGAQALTTTIKWSEDAEALRDVFGVGLEDVVKFAKDLGATKEDLADPAKLEAGVPLKYKGKLVCVLKLEGASAKKLADHARDALLLYSPDQERDERGRWTDGGGGGDNPGKFSPTGSARAPRAGGGGQTEKPAAREHRPARTFETTSADRLVAGFSQLEGWKRNMVSNYTPEDYEKMGARVFVSPDGQAGYAIKPDGDLISVYSLAKGGGNALMKDAIRNGAKKLDCFDLKNGTSLPKFYATHGFVEVGRDKWNDAYAPPGWDYEKIGRPDIVYMELRQ